MLEIPYAAISIHSPKSPFLGYNQGLQSRPRDRMSSLHWHLLNTSILKLINDPYLLPNKGRFAIQVFLVIHTPSKTRFESLEDKICLTKFWAPLGSLIFEKKTCLGELPGMGRSTLGCGSGRSTFPSLTFLCLKKTYFASGSPFRA